VNARILIVEDEPKLAELLRDYLAAAGYATTWLARGDEVEPWVRKHAPALVLLDLMLPGKDGLEVCRALRAFTAVPVVMMTARIEEVDRLLGLELGADDYICKPYSPREVVARVKAVLRRATNVAVDPGLKLDAEGFRAALDGKALDLTAIEFRLLAALAAHPGRILTRERLMDAIYSDQRVVSDRTVDSHVKKLRRKLAAAAPARELIHSVYGLGYRFEA
jgi:two-component system response regulator BaeR